MPSIKPVGGKTQLEVERFDEGLDTGSGPNEISIYGSPDCLNVEFSQRGSVKTRLGCSQVVSAAIVTNTIDAMASFNGSHIAWSNGTMYVISGTTGVEVSGTTGTFVTGTYVANQVYQQVLFCSDGTSGPWRYETDGSFYKMGIPTPSAPTGVQCNVTAVGPPADTYFYRVSFVNTHVVEGTAGSMSVTQTLASTNVVSVQGIPIAPASAPADARFIYRASSTAGPFRYIGEIANNTATVFTDTVGAATWAVGEGAGYDNGEPTPYTTIRHHKDRLFMDDSTDRSIVRFTDYRNPYVSAAANFINTDKGVGSTVQAIGVQNDLVTVFKQESIWVIDLQVPGDSLSFQWVKTPGNLGIVGPKALTEINNAILFMGQRNGKISGIHMLSGVGLIETQDNRLRSDRISDRVEAGILAMPRAYWANTAITTYDNRVYIAFTDASLTSNKHILWLDTARLTELKDVGSWALWDGRGSQMNCFVSHLGTLYGGSSQADGLIFQMEIADSYSDNGAAINSYFKTKFFGGEPDLESWIKDWRLLNIWYNKNGLGTMDVYRRTDSETSDSIVAAISLTAGTSVYGTAIFGVGTYGGGVANQESQKTIGVSQGRRLQLNFTNQNTINQAFEVHGVKVLMNLRRQVKEID